LGGLFNHKNTNESIFTIIDAPPPSAPQRIIGREKRAGVHAKVRKSKESKDKVKFDLI
jgi:hypothetical protein